MPSRIAEPSVADTTATQELLFITFPPFPKPPPGVTLIPFKDFRACGIQLFAEVVGGQNEEDIELDGLGIPTVELRVKHSTDECKSNTRKRKCKKKTAAAEGVPARKVPWYKEWEEGEDLRITKGKNISHVDRLFHAANDFRVNRTWPPITSGVSQLWDQFCLYVGLLVNPSVYRKPSKEGEADDDNDDNDGPTDIQTDTKDTSESVLPSDDPARSAYSVELDDDDDDDEGTLQARKTDLEEQREEKLIVFLNNLEKSVTIFLSSHMREQGLIWSERNLVNAPHLLSFFLNFVLRNCVLQKVSHECGICNALDIVELAKKELPLTYKIGQALPDVLNDGSKECFGRKGSLHAAYATFVNEALAHDDNMEVLVRAENLSDRHSGVDDLEAEGRDLEDIQDSEDKAEDDGDVRSDKEDSYNVVQRAENATSDLTMSSDSMYTFDYSFMDDIPAVSSVPSTPIHNTQGNDNDFEYPQVPTAFSAADLADFDRLLSTVTQQDLDTLDFPSLVPYPGASSFSSEPGSELNNFSFPSTAASGGSGCEFNFSLTDFDFEKFLPRSSPSPAYLILNETPTSLNSDSDIAIPLPLLDEMPISLNSDSDITIPLPLHKPSAPQALVHQSLGPQADSDGPR
ncbi:uncharacterized protein EDB91DRAFT_1250230 [Suillus paluster]|uniref:uncharacterized protein n=1 Tax=Suillus paluster TaxID=48578 RepID=UPI001B877945|nr:uncharacterized protein EDB91DRAFT_1250230 [Suillus paluster]KAG1735899.1 hypothetical protein EDB91DRAFT_1250230 [Suillus paluster]